MTLLIEAEIAASRLTEMASELRAVESETPRLTAGTKVHLRQLADRADSISRTLQVEIRAGSDADSSLVECLLRAQVRLGRAVTAVAIVVGLVVDTPRLVEMAAGMAELDVPAAVEDVDSTEEEVVAILAPTTEAQRELLIREAMRIYPHARPDKIVSNARNTCSSVRGGVAEQRLIENTIKRFGGAPSLRPDPTEEQARQLLDLVRSSEWCLG